MIDRICVYLGGFKGADDRFLNSAKEFGARLAQNKIGLVYGGGNVGLMGALANSVLENGGEVIGVIPKGLVDREIGHKGLTELIVVNTMHERKAKMAELADAFVALPGGYGTLEELFETITSTILEENSKPCSILNVNGYYDKMLLFLDSVKDQGFITKEDRDFLIVEDDPAILLEKLKKFEPYKSTRWKLMETTN